MTKAFTPEFTRLMDEYAAAALPTGPTDLDTPRLVH